MRSSPSSSEIDLRPRARELGRSVLPWLALIYGAVGALYLIAPPTEPAAPLAAGALVSGVAFLAAWAALARVPIGLVNVVVASVALVGVGFALMFVVATGDPAQSVVLVISILGIACVVMHMPSMLLAIVVGIGGWALLASDFTTAERTHWLINLIATTGLAVLISWARVRTASQLERERRVADSARAELMAQAAELAAARDAALESARTKAEFLGNVSHELRTPLGGIIGLADLVLDSPLDAEQHENMRTLRGAAEALLAIIDDLLDFTRLESGTARLPAVDEVDLRELIADCLRLLDPEAGRKNLSLRARVGDAVPEKVLAEPNAIRRVLLNLLGNGVKFTEAGGVEVDVRRAADGRICFEVRDTGIGIPESDRDRVWEAFVQADGSRRRRYEGTGLGLAISRALVELMGGEIALESEVGRGTTFRMWLPLAAAATVAQRPAPQLS